MSDLFTALKENISALAAADRYGIEHNRQGMARCIFHNERTASMKIYPGTSKDYQSGFCCFGCHKTGSVIDLVAQHMGTSIRDAALMMAQDYGISYDDQKKGFQTESEAVKAEKRKQQLRKFINNQIEHYSGIVLDYVRELEIWMESADPDTEEYCLAIFDRDLAGDRADIFLYGSYEEKAELILKGKEELEQYESKLRSLTSGTGTDGRRAV